MTLKPVRALVGLTFYGELPTDEGEADAMFEKWIDAIMARLDREEFGLGIAPGSFSVEDCDTEDDYAPPTT